MPSDPTTPEPLPDRVLQAFRERYGQAPAFLVRAPGRVNLIGEHTDYNDGFVLPLAIDRAVWLALRPRSDRRVDVWSTDFGESAAFQLDDLARGRGGGDGGSSGWIEYLKGTGWALETTGHLLAGWDGVLGSDVPIGAGLSSSAALELATARAFAAVSDLAWDAPAMARLAQKAENEWVGMNCGIMDQMISAVGEDGRAVLIDCRSLRTRPVPLPSDTVVVILDTATRRGLVDSKYNERRRQCEAAAAHFGVPALRDLSPAELEGRVHELDGTTARRARHVVTENDRTVEAAAAMDEGDADRLGRLMDASHASLRDDFQVSSPELDAMVDIARQTDGCLGARMTGAGFGGCAVALVHEARSDAFVATVTAEYERQTGLEPALYTTGASPGTRLLDPADL